MYTLANILVYAPSMAAEYNPAELPTYIPISIYLTKTSSHDLVETQVSRKYSGVIYFYLCKVLKLILKFTVAFISKNAIPLSENLVLNICMMLYINLTFM